jgi:hypothetical protein
MEGELKNLCAQTNPSVQVTYSTKGDDVEEGLVLRVDFADSGDAQGSSSDREGGEDPEGTRQVVTILPHGKDEVVKVCVRLCACR